jgi:hypothetical protein
MEKLEFQLPQIILDRVLVLRGGKLLPLLCMYPVNGLEAAYIAWIFGGTGVDGLGHTGYLNDLWRLNTSSLIWTWVAGSNNTGNGIYFIC